MKRIRKILLAVCIGTCSIIAQTNLENGNITDPAKSFFPGNKDKMDSRDGVNELEISYYLNENKNMNFQLSQETYIVSLLPDMHCDKKDHCLNIRGIVSGILLVAAGTVLSVNGYYCGEKHYKSYKHSAFTENTDKKRRKVAMSNLKCVGGGVIAGTGLLVTILSF